MLERERMLGQEKKGTGGNHHPAVSSTPHDYRKHTIEPAKLDKQHLDYHNSLHQQNSAPSHSNYHQDMTHRQGTGTVHVSSVSGATINNQQEGIQARLMDTHDAKPISQIQTHASYINSSRIPMDSTAGVDMHKPYLAPHCAPYHHDYKPPVVLVPSSKPPVSKLDIEEQRLREARQSDDFNSDDSDMEEAILSPEENKLQKLLLIADGPPIPMDKSPQKLQYMEQFGLTTQHTRKGMYFEYFSITSLYSFIGKLTPSYIYLNLYY